MNTKVRALIWEECRVSGVLALVCFSLGVLILVVSMLGDDPYTWWYYKDYALLVVLGIPMVCALLFVLGLDYSGHLTAGFPRRILNLPVQTHTTVAITFTLRTFFMFLLGLGLLGACAVRFGQAPWLSSILLIITLYLCIQVLDWLRQPISGLASAIILALLGLLVLALGNFEVLINHFAKQNLGILEASIALCTLYVLGLGVSIAAVSATRRGKRVGPPELWELPALWTQNRHARQEPFASPMDAAVWFERSRSPFVMPGLTLLIFTMLFAAMWLGTDRATGTSFNNGFPDWTIYSSLDCALLGSFLLAAIGYGLYRGAFWWKRVSTPRMIPFLYPATAGEITHAHLRAAAIQVGTVLLLVGLIFQGSFLLRHGGFTSSVFTAALREGYVSWRELIWSFLAPILLTGLMAWAFLSPNWLWGAYIFLPIGASILLVICGFDNVDGVMNAAICLSIIAVIALAAILAWRKGLMAGRTLVGLFGIWLLLAWLLFPMDLVATIGAQDVTRYDLLQLGLTSLAWASLGPMPYIGILIFTNRLRHGKRNYPQNPSLHKRRPSGHRVRNALAIVGVIALSLWLKWPMEPTWRMYLHQKGFATSIRELNARYPEVPDDENLALRYRTAWEKLDACAAELKTQQNADHTQYTDSNGIPSDAATLFMQQLPIMGFADVRSDAPMTPEQTQAIRTYWDAVGKHVAPMLHAAAESGLTRSFYSPVDPMGAVVSGGHLARTRELARLLSLEALLACVENRPHDAAQAICAIYPLSFTARQEPLIISHLVSVAIMSIGAGALEDTCKSIALDDSALAALDHCLPSARTLEQSYQLEQAIVGESAYSLNYQSQLWFGVNHHFSTKDMFFLTLLQVFWQPHYEEIFFIHEFNEKNGRKYPVIEAGNQGPVAKCDLTRVFFFQLLSNLRVVNAEWRIRTMMDLAHVGIAVERYRLAAGHFPEKLEELVPAYISAVPLDPYTQMAEPLRYLAKPDGSYIIYSVYEDGEDEKGAPYSYNGKDRKGDLSFTLLPPEKRMATAYLMDQPLKNVAP